MTVSELATETRIKVCHVITRLDVGGAQETAVRTCALLDASRYDVVLVAGADRGCGGSLVEEARDLGVQVRIVPSLVGPVRPHRDLASINALRNVFREERPAIVHTHSSKAGVVGRLAARAARVPSVVHTVHGWSFHDNQSRTSHRAYRALERVLAPLTDALVVVTHADRHAGLDAGVGQPDQYTLVRSGIDTAFLSIGAARAAALRSELGIPDTARVLGTVGRLSDQKDPAALIDAFARVRAANPAAHLLLVGDGPLRPAMQALVASHGLEGTVTFAGVRRDTDDLLQLMDVFVLPSRWEGLPRALLQAMVAGVPVVATPVGGVQEVLVSGSTGLLVPPGDVVAIADAAQLLLADDDLAHRVAAAAREQLRGFATADMVAATERLYAGLAGWRTVP